MRKATCPQCGKARIVRGDGLFGKHTLVIKPPGIGQAPLPVDVSGLTARTVNCPGSGTDAGLW